MEKRLLRRKDPIILLGTHRSGTSLLGELLSDIGVFMGRKQNAHHEAWHFLDNNKKILDIAHSDWDLPLVFESLLKSETTLRTVVQYMQSETTSHKMIRHFFGRRLALKEKISPSQTPWGWKDPRTNITFPLWYQIYPDARFIMLIRNGVDVANSLKVREGQKLTRIHSRATSTRCQTLDESFRLWEEYNEFFIRYRNIIPEDKILTIKYEDLLTSSHENLEIISDFLDLENHEDFIRMASLRINPDNANKFRNDSELIEFYYEVRNTYWMKELGYSDIPGIRKTA